MTNGSRARVVALALVLAALGPLAGAAEAKKKGKKKPGPVVTRTAVATASGEAAIESATAVCPGKTRATGGGFEITPATATVVSVVYESLKVGQNAWRVSAQTTDPPPPDATVTLTASVYCRKRAPKTSTQSTTGPTPGSQLIGPTLPVVCPGGRKPVAGGWATPPPVLGITLANAVLASSRSGAGWQSTVISADAGPSSLTSHVYCAKQKKGLAEVVLAGSPVSTNFAESTATAVCAGTRSVTAGGFSQSGATVAGPIGFMLTFRSQRLARGSWVVSSVLASNGAVVTLSSHAYCA